MALPFLALGAAGLKAFQGSKLQGVQDGTKIIRPPKTKLGKLLGTVSGRTQANELQKQIQNEKNQTMRNPVGGSVQFGTQTKQANLPFLAIVAATILGVVFFLSGSTKKRRR